MYFNNKKKFEIFRMLCLCMVYKSKFPTEFHNLTPSCRLGDAEVSPRERIFDFINDCTTIVTVTSLSICNLTQCNCSSIHRTKSKYLSFKENCQNSNSGFCTPNPPAIIMQSVSLALWLYNEITRLVI